MVGGQVVDIEGRFQSRDEVYAMQRLKTGALIRAAAEGAAVIAQADAQILSGVCQYGESLGLLFQITDDILDEDQDKDDGKNLLSHMNHSAVARQRDQVAWNAREALQVLKPPPVKLISLVDHIARRVA